MAVALSWMNFSIGVIAFATLMMALVQLGVIIYAAGIARRVDRLSKQLEQDIQPLLTSLVSIGGSADRASVMAVAQIERFDRMFSEFARRVDDVLVVLERLVVAPAREGRAVVGAVQAAFAVFREVRRGSRARPTRTEDEDALFIG